MKKRSKLFAVMLMLVLLLAGCSGKTETVSDTGSSEVPESESENKKEETEESSETDTKYWVDITEIAIEMPGQYELEAQITDENYKRLSSTNSTGDVSFTSTTEGCDEGYMQTIISANNKYKYKDLAKGTLLCIKFGPVDLYTGKAFEDYTPDDDFSSLVYYGQEMVFDTHNFTTTVDGTGYDISWRMGKQIDDNGMKEVYYITHPIDYNGIGFLLSGSFYSTPDVVARADEVGGWPNMRMEDYFEFLSTPHLIDCRN